MVNIINKETNYLYAKSNHEIYHSVLNEHNNKDCIYSRNLIAMMDGAEEKISPFYQGHILECKICQKLAQASSWKAQKIRGLIPKVSLPDHFLSTTKGDLSEAVALFKNREGRERVSKETSLAMLLKPLQELMESKLILKSICQGGIIALFTFLLLLSISR